MVMLDLDELTTSSFSKHSSHRAELSSRLDCIPRQHANFRLIDVNFGHMVWRLEEKTRGSKPSTFAYDVVDAIGRL